MPRDTALRDLGRTVGVQRCSARGPRSVTWLLVGDVAPPRRELRLKAGYEIFTVTINPAEERAKPTVDGMDGTSCSRALQPPPQFTHLPLESVVDKIPTETLEPSLDPLHDVNDMETIESASLKDDVVDLSARLARVEGSIVSVINSKIQVVQQALEASVAALMMRVVRGQTQWGGAENRRPCSQSNDVWLTPTEAAWRRSKVSCILVCLFFLLSFSLCTLL